MPEFQITAPDGRKFKVSGATREGALAALKKQIGQGGGTQTGGVGKDVAKATGSGLVSGLVGLAGLPGDTLTVLGELTGKGAGFLGASPETQESVASTVRRAVPGFGTMPNTGELQKTVADVTGFTPYEPRTTAGKYAGTAAEFAPGAAAFGVPGGARSALAFGAKYGIVPGLASEAAGQATEGTAAEPYARLAGALTGAAAPGVARRVITPFPAPAERVAMANTLRGEGVTDLTAGQKTGSQRLRYMESELGGMRGQAMMENQGEQFTKAALSRAGINANRATPEVIDNAFSRIGQSFDNLAARNDLVPVNRQLVDDLVGSDGVLTTYKALGGEAPIVEKTILDIGQRLASGHKLTGDYYKSTTSRLARSARATNDPELKDALHGIRNALDDAMEQSIASINPSDLGAWRQARRQYRNILVIEKAATGAGENAAAGLISPSQLRNATVQQGRRAYARGQGDFAGLARAGEAVMKPLPQSGTAPRTAARNMLGATVPHMVGAGAGAAAGGDWQSAMAGALLGGAIPSVVGRGMISRPGRAFLGNQVMTSTRPISIDDIAAALTASSSPLRLPAPQPAY